MIIDIEEDKVVVDEFCDAVVVGAAQTREAMPPQPIEIAACKSGYIEGVVAVTAAEKAIMTQKKQIIKSFMKKATPEEIMECFGGEDSEDDR
jgi:hypothetical protein